MLGEPGFGFKIAMVWALSLTISFTSEVWKSMHFHFCNISSPNHFKQ